MCARSMIMEDFGRRHDWGLPYYLPPIPALPGPSPAEFDALKKELEALRELLKAAKRFDEATDQPDCEDADKVALLRKLADALGVDLSEVLDG